MSSNSTDRNERFAALFLKSQRQIYGYILSVVPDANDADELFQETSLILWKKLDEFDIQRDFVRWGCGVAHNVIRNWRVKQGRDRHVFSETLLSELIDVRIERSAWLERCTAALAECVKRLTRPQQRLLKLVYGGKHTTLGISSQLAISENAVYQRTHRVRSQLTECVQRVIAAEDEAEQNV